jgi:hypothetical protein
MPIADLSQLDQACHALATAMLNQVGVEWDECCDSVELFVARQGAIDDDDLTTRLRCEAYRYGDM